MGLSGERAVIGDSPFQILGVFRHAESVGIGIAADVTASPRASRTRPYPPVKFALDEVSDLVRRLIGCRNYAALVGTGKVQVSGIAIAGFFVRSRIASDEIGVAGVSIAGRTG